MRSSLPRRGLLALPLCAAGCEPARSRPRTVADLEAELGGRLGVAAIDTGDGRAVEHRAHERFTMCSTFKLPLAGLVLERVDAGALRLDDELAYGARDLVEYAPVVQANLARGALSLRTLCEAAVTVSDNAAANLLLARLGGPAALTAAFRRWGDARSRLDRFEPELNGRADGDPRDTTTPAAMRDTVRALLFGPVLREPSRAQLLRWMEATSTGRERLRAGFPAGVRAGDKTGTGPDGLVHDVAVVLPPGRAPLVVACYTHAPRASMSTRNAVFRSVARGVLEALDARR